MTHLVKTLLMLLATASCLVSDSPSWSKKKGLSTNSVASVSSIPKPKSWVYRNWENGAYILRKG